MGRTETRLYDTLVRIKPALLKKWLRAVTDTYPVDTSTFLRTRSDQFANPVGATTSQSIETLYDQLAGDMESDKVLAALDDIVRIRAVQDFTPAQAVGFVFLLKGIIRAEFKDRLSDPELTRDLLELESRIDSLALLAFNNYMKCREKLYELKAKEVQQVTYRLLQRANLIVGNEEGEGENRAEGRPTS